MYKENLDLVLVKNFVKDNNLSLELLSLNQLKQLNFAKFSFVKLMLMLLKRRHEE